MEKRRDVILIIFFGIFLINLSFVYAFSGDGSGTLAEPFIITNCTQLQEISDAVKANYSLNNNIDCSDTVNWNSGEGFAQIVGFNGAFLGNGYNIENLFANKSGTTSRVALFSTTLAGTNITDLNLYNVSIEGYDYVSALVGSATGTNISNVFANGTITPRRFYGGGLVGSLGSDSIILNSGVSDMNIFAHNSTSSSSYGYIGGLVGRTIGTVLIQNSSVTNTNIYGSMRLGGLVGQVASDAVINRSRVENLYISARYQSVGGIVGYLASDAYIYNSYSTGWVNSPTIQFAHVGGLVGSCYGIIEDSYSLANVSYSNAGGLAGYIDSNGYVNRSYFAGNLTLNGAGISLSTTRCASSYWDNQKTIATTNSCGTQKTTAQMKEIATFTNVSQDSAWDFVENPYNDSLNNSIWNIDSESSINNGYPYLVGVTADPDVYSPTVTLNSPSEDYVNDTSSSLSITFNCSATDETALENISLYLTNSTNSGFSLNQTLNLSGVSNYSTWDIDLSSGEYTWNCLAFDSSGNSAFSSSNRTITINLEEEEEEENLGGSSRGGSSGPSRKVYDVNTNFPSIGNNFSLRYNEKIKFSLNLTKHTLTMQNFNSTSAKVKIESEPIIAWLEKDVVYEFDLDKDSVKDIKVIYKGRDKLNRATIFIQEIAKASEDFNEELESEVEESKKSIQSKNYSYKYWIVLVIIFVVLFILKSGRVKSWYKNIYKD